MDDFVGTSNFFEGELKGDLLSGKDFQLEVAPPAGESFGPVTAAMRPEKIEILTEPETPPAALAISLNGTLVVVTFLGLIVRLVVHSGARK